MYATVYYKCVRCGAFLPHRIDTTLDNLDEIPALAVPAFLTHVCQSDGKRGVCAPCQVIPLTETAAAAAGE